jgi:hypothetical protein
MTTEKSIATFILLMSTVTIIFGQNKSTIEIFLVDKVTYSDTTNQKSGQYFKCSATDLPANVFIADNEIIGYEISKDTSQQYNQGQLYYLRLSKSGQDKLRELKAIPLCCGQRFVISVNRQPIYGGYFWNSFSSFGCAWLTITAIGSDRLPIERGLPYVNFTDKHGDPRNDKILIDAFKMTGRLIEN